jgi:hypothetical protein
MGIEIFGGSHSGKGEYADYVGKGKRDGTGNPDIPRRKASDAS